MYVDREIPLEVSKKIIRMHLKQQQRVGERIVHIVDD